MKLAKLVLRTGTKEKAQTKSAKIMQARRAKAVLYLLVVGKIDSALCDF